MSQRKVMKEMKKTASIFLVIILLLSISGCGKSPVLPPVRNATGRMWLNYDQDITFENIYSKAVAVVRIKIGDWLGEDKEHAITFYKAEVLEYLKGSIPKTFTFLQNGCSTSTVDGYPLLTYGNELLVFLYESTREGYDYEDIYGNIGSYLTVFDVSYDKNGNRYYGARRGLFVGAWGISHNYIYNDAVYKEFLDTITAKDPIYSELKFSHIFAEADIKTLMANQ